jgi:hypothetical protein
MALFNLSLRAARMPAVRDQFGSGRAARWIGAIVAVALLSCDGARATEPRVLLLRGWLNMFSGGLDRLADELRARGIKAEVRRHLYWTTAVSEILRDRAAGNTGPLTLVGHSQGGNDAIVLRPGFETPG